MIMIELAGAACARSCCRHVPFRAPDCAAVRAQGHELLRSSDRDRQGTVLSAQAPVPAVDDAARLRVQARGIGAGTARAARIRRAPSGASASAGSSAPRHRRPAPGRSRSRPRRPCLPALRCRSSSAHRRPHPRRSPMAARQA